MNKWYDIYDDWELIEATFAQQYGIRLLNEPDMEWREFSALLSGIMPETPLGQIIQVRSEEDKDILKTFTAEQKRIRSEWRSRFTEKVSEKDAEAAIREFQEMMAKAFGEKNI
ncbi:hypothetical protein GOQ29_05000 [Clostridium sp. D2Q-14]|uniref:Gp15 family bacteriophage protein n=1 Tax=Anaeromonas gelatinilytica TaxID=2683194 RepID=UPI00193B2F27|nr:hypothetical protein [Anaeromonas gelatinilytica]